MNDTPTQHAFDSFDGTRIVWQELGAGHAKPLILLHGFFSDAKMNWIRYGHAQMLADAGFRVIMPDLRGHGESARPHDAASYPHDVLASDGLALVAHLGLGAGDYDLGGYSLGGRTVARMIARGARPRRAIIAGMGLEGLIHTGHRADHFRHILKNIGKHRQGSPEWMAEAFLKTTGGDPQALLGVIDSFADTPRDALAGFDMPILVLVGDADDDNGSAEALADILPRATLRQIPGNHMSAVVNTELGTAIADFLTGSGA